MFIYMSLFARCKLTGIISLLTEKKGNYYLYGVLTVVAIVGVLMLGLLAPVKRQVSSFYHTVVFRCKK